MNIASKLLTFILSVAISVAANAGSKATVGGNELMILDNHPKAPEQTTLRTYDNGKDWNDTSPVSDSRCIITSNGSKRFSAIKYLDGKFMIVGDSGAICSWDESRRMWYWRTAQTDLGNYDLRDITLIDNSKGNTLVAVGSSGTIQYATKTGSDYGEWQKAASPTTENLNSVAFGAGVAVAVGGNSTIIYFKDDAGGWQLVPKKWWQHAEFTRGVYVDFPACSNDSSAPKGMFVALAGSATIWTSLDGIHWVVSAGLDSLSHQPFTDVAFASGNDCQSGQFVAVGDGIAAYSSSINMETGLVTWKPDNNAFSKPYSKKMTSIIYSSKHKAFVATYNKYGSLEGLVYSSYAGNASSQPTWNAVTLDSDVKILGSTDATLIANNDNLVAVVYSPSDKGTSSIILTATNPAGPWTQTPTVKWDSEAKSLPPHSAH